MDGVQGRSACPLKGSPGAVLHRGQQDIVIDIHGRHLPLALCFGTGLASHRGLRCHELVHDMWGQYTSASINECLLVGCPGLS